MMICTTLLPRWLFMLTCTAFFTEMTAYDEFLRDLFGIIFAVFGHTNDKGGIRWKRKRNSLLFVLPCRLP